MVNLLRMGCQQQCHPLPSTDARPQLLFVLRGVMTVDAVAGTWMVAPDRALWLPAGAVARASCRTLVDGLRVCVTADRSLGTPREVVGIGVSPLLRELVLRLATVAAAGDDVPRTTRLVAVLLDEVVTAPHEPVPLPVPRDARLRKLVAGLREDPGNPTTIDVWAREAGISQRSLRRLFLQETGLSPGQWRRRLQLTLAIERLARGASIAEAAFDVGYESPSAFTAMFKRVLGTTPGRYCQEPRCGLGTCPLELPSCGPPVPVSGLSSRPPADPPPASGLLPAVAGARAARAPLARRGTAAG